MGQTGDRARKALVALAGGVVAFLIADLVSMEFAFQIAASVFVGGALFVTVYLAELGIQQDRLRDRLDEYALQVSSLADQRDAGMQQIRLLTRYIEDQLPRIIGQSLNMKQREEPLVRELAHSLNTPLAQMEAAILSGSVKDDPRGVLVGLEICKSYISAFRHVATLAEDTGAWEPHSLSDTIRSAANLYSLRQNTNLDFAISVPDALPGYGKNALVAMLLPLLENAIEAAPYGGKVVVEAESEESTWVLHVTNDLKNGHVLSDEMYRGGWSSKTGHEGIGLDVVRNLLAVHGGSDLSHSHVNGRVTFSVRLPRRRK